MMQVNNSSISYQIKPLDYTNQPPSKTKSTQEQRAEQPRVERIDVDEKSIQLLEQEKQANQNRTGYDQPSRQNKTAVSAYQSVGNIEQRENVQQLLGVDIFA